LSEDYIDLHDMSREELIAALQDVRELLHREMDRMDEERELTRRFLAADRRHVHCPKCGANN
jgi:hypothetical protein